MKKIIKQEISFLKSLRQKLYNGGSAYVHVARIDRRVKKLSKLI